MAFASDKGRQGAAGQGAGGYDIDNSLRFEDGSTSYLSRTKSTGDSNQKWTYSVWIKRGNLVNSHLLSNTNSINRGLHISFTSGNQLEFFEYDNTTDRRLITTQVFRDTSAWYHLVFVWDSNNAAQDERMRLYVNGERVTDFSTEFYPSTQGEASTFNTTSYGDFEIGRNYYLSGEKYDGYMAEVNFIDGDALDQYDFGEFDATYGHWKPIAYAGTYGTNGFYLDFKNSGSLGTDVSGEANNWTPTNLAATDQMLDSPTNNFATLNGVDKPSQHTLSEGNLKIQGNTTGRYTTYANFLLPESGKWYWEVKVSGNTTGYWGHGVFEEDATRSAVNWDSNAASIQYYLNQIKIEAGTATFNWSGTVLGIKWDADNKAIQFTDGTSSSSSYTLSGDRYKIGCSGNATTQSLQAQIYNFGQDSTFANNDTGSAGPYTDSNDIGDFFYEPPTDFLALCTKNLPPIADGLWADGNNQAFNTITWTGNGGTGYREYTGVGFKPDLVWAKNRSGSFHHTMYNSISGAGANTELTTDENWIEGGNNPSEYDYLSSFEDDGFKSYRVGSNNPYYFNDSTYPNYVAWNWKAGGTAVSNTEGTNTTAMVSANPTAGFSIISYSGNSTTHQSVGHGLNKAPEIFIQKRRNGTSSWLTSTTAIDGTNDYLWLDTTAGANATTQAVPDEDVAYVSGNGYGYNTTGGTYIAYAFHSVDGYSKVGSYTGNGSTDGTFVHTGFKPAYVMIKRTTTGNWTVLDAARDPDNNVKEVLYPASLSTELTSSTGFDFLANGFKSRSTGTDWNSSNSKYIYIAFAEHPFKYSTAR